MSKSKPIHHFPARVIRNPSNTVNRLYATHLTSHNTNTLSHSPSLALSLSVDDDRNRFNITNRVYAVMLKSTPYPSDPSGNSRAKKTTTTKTTTTTTITSNVKCKTGKKNHKKNKQHPKTIGFHIGFLLPTILDWSPFSLQKKAGCWNVISWIWVHKEYLGTRHVFCKRETVILSHSNN